MRKPYSTPTGKTLQRVSKEMGNAVAFPWEGYRGGVQQWLADAEDRDRLCRQFELKVLA
jgi:hypothetical protein